MTDEEWEEYESYQTPKWHPESWNWLWSLRQWWFVRKAIRREKFVIKTLRKINRELDKLL